MPMHEFMMGTSLAMDVHQPSRTAKKQFTIGTWAIPKTGCYKGDLGMVIFDTYNQAGHPGDIDVNCQCRMLFIPRLNEKPLEGLQARNHQLSKTKTKRPRPPAKLVKVRSADSIVKYYDYRKVKVECTVLGCKSSTCTHPGRRYHLRGVTLLPVSGLAIVTQNYFNLDLAQRMPDATWSIYKNVLGLQDSEVPGQFGFNPRLVPIPSSWSFMAGEQVEAFDVPGLVDATVCNIFATGRLECMIEVGDPVIHKVCCSYRRLRKHFKLGDVVRVLHNYSGIEAGTDGLVCKVERDYVEVAFDIRDDRTYPLHRNSIAKVASEARVSYKDPDRGQILPTEDVARQELFTGGVPFKYLPVYTIGRHPLRLLPGRIMDISRPQATDPPSLQVSGLKVLVEFQSGGTQVWFDWDSIRRLSNRRYIQDDGLKPDALSVRSFGKDPHDYFSFKAGYLPVYSQIERHLLKMPGNNAAIPQPGITFATLLNQNNSLPDVGGMTPQWNPQEVMQEDTAAAWDPGSRTPMPISTLPDPSDEASGSYTPLHLRFSDENSMQAFTPSHTSSAVNPWFERETSVDIRDLLAPQAAVNSNHSHWILDYRIREGLKGMHLAVAIIDDPEKNREVQLLFKDGDTKIFEVSRSKNSVKIGAEIFVWQIPLDYCSNALGEPDTSSNLFIVCRGLYTGTLGRSIKRERIFDESKAEWVSYYLLREIEVTPPASGSRNKSYEERFLESSIRILGCDLAIVEVTKSQRTKFSSIMSKNYR